VVRSAGPRGALVLVGISMVLLMSPIAAAASLGNGSAAAVTSSAAPAQKTFLGGWGVTNSAPGSITQASASWVEPTVTCTLSTNERQDLAVAVGIGPLDFWSIGLNHSALGVWAVCDKGQTTTSYFAAYTMQAGVTCRHFYDGCVVSTMTVRPGDSMTAATSWSPGGNVSVSISDTTTGQSFALNENVVAMDPNAGFCAGFHFTDLPKFSKFTLSCSLTINGHTRPVGAFGSPNVLFEFLMVDLPSHRLLSSVSPLSASGLSFQVSWLRSEPS
jgi:hypothetical protein